MPGDSIYSPELTPQDRRSSSKSIGMTRSGGKAARIRRVAALPTPYDRADSSEGGPTPYDRADSSDSSENWLSSVTWKIAESAGRVVRSVFMSDSSSSSSFGDESSSSGNGGTDATTSENMEKEISEACAEEALGGVDIADAEKDLEIVGDGEVVETVTAEKIVTSQMDSDLVSDILVQGEVASQFSADLEKEISSDFAFDSVIIGEASFKTLADHEKLEKSANQMVKTDTEAYKHDTESTVIELPKEADAPGGAANFNFSRPSLVRESYSPTESKQCMLERPNSVCGSHERVMDSTSNNNEVEISSDFAFDSVTIGEDSFKTSADHDKLEISANQMVKTDTEAYKHETETVILSSKEDGTIEDPATQDLNKENSEPQYHEFSLGKLRKLLKEVLKEAGRR